MPPTCHCEAFFAEAILSGNSGDCFVTKPVLSSVEGNAPRNDKQAKFSDGHEAFHSSILFIFTADG